VARLQEARGTGGGKEEGGQKNLNIRHSYRLTPRRRKGNHRSSSGSCALLALADADTRRRRPFALEAAASRQDFGARTHAHTRKRNAYVRMSGDATANAGSHGPLAARTP